MLRPTPKGDQVCVGANLDHRVVRLDSRRKRERIEQQITLRRGAVGYQLVNLDGSKLDLATRLRPCDRGILQLVSGIGDLQHKVEADGAAADALANLR